MFDSGLDNTFLANILENFMLFEKKKIT